MNGETDTVDFPLVAIVDTGCVMIEQDGVRMRGCMDISINAEIHSIPETEANGGTTLADHRAIVTAVEQILGDDAAVTYCDGLNDTTIFDIIASNATMDEQDGRRVSTMQLTVIACPLSQ